MCNTKMSSDEFDAMNWHDCTVYGMSFPDASFKLALDLDYIVEWKITDHESGYTFLVAPATLVFENTYNVSIDIETSSQLVIDNIIRKDKRTNSNTLLEEWDWVIECNQGVIEFCSSGFMLHLKGTPTISDSQKFNREDGINFFTTRKDAVLDHPE